MLEYPEGYRRSALFTKEELDKIYQHKLEVKYGSTFQEARRMFGEPLEKVPTFFFLDELEHIKPTKVFRCDIFNGVRMASGLPEDLEPLDIS